MIIINLIVIIAAIAIAANAGYQSFQAIWFGSALVMLIINSRIVLSPHVVFDQKMRAMASVKESFRLTKGNTFKMIGWMLLISIINSIGGAVYIGVLISFPLSIYLLTKVYYQLITVK